MPLRASLHLGGAGDAALHAAHLPVTSRRGRGRERGVTLVEFALTLPIAFALLFGTIVLGIVVMDQIQLNNAVRDGARAAGICGGAGRTSDTNLPNGAACTTTNLQAYVQSHLQSIPNGISITVTVYLGGGTSTDLNSCSANKLVEVNATYPQALYVPLLGAFLGDNGTSSRTISATAESVCSQ